MKKQHCCELMTNQINHKCELHEDPFNCPNHLVYYSMKHDEYSLIIHDGGGSSITIKFCPWCGLKLPDSKSDLWFDTLEKLGFDGPYNQNIPAEFRSDKWYENNLQTLFGLIL